MPRCDFSGYATKYNIKCSDGRIIRHGAFKDCNGKKVPLVWQHMHNDPENILGHAVLEEREDGIYAYATFNNTKSGQNAKALVEHGDIDSMSIYANQLRQNGNDVLHGALREVSLVLAPANPGARIENLAFQHSDGSVTDVDDEAIIYSGVSLSHSEDEEELAHGNEETVGDVWATLTEKQRNVVYDIMAQVLEGGDSDEDDEVEHSEEGGETVKKNVFTGTATDGDTARTALTHDQMSTIFADAQKMGSLKQSVLAHAKEYGISNIELLFPEARNLNVPPELIKRDTEWVSGFLSACRHSPFSRIKSMFADITADEARAKGYITGNKKVEEVFPVMTRKTGPTTIYKKQKLDRDDIIDINDFDVVAWIRREMRIMLDEEIARACLIGDGRTVGDPDKIDETCIRPIAKDDEFYTMTLDLSSSIAGGVNPGSIEQANAIIALIITKMEDYEGSGNTILYARADFVNMFRLVTDKIGRYVYDSDSAVANALGVGRIVRLPILKTANNAKGIAGVIVDPRDYVIGADKGGQITSFDDFDIDYNQYKYLMETRISGALTKHHAALVLKEGTPE